MTIVPFVGQILAAVGLTGYLAWRNGSQAVNELAEQLGQETTQQVKKHLSQFTQTPALFLELNASAIRASQLDLAEFDRLKPLFWEQLGLSKEVTTLLVGTREGEFLRLERGEASQMTVRDRTTASQAITYKLDEAGNPGDRLQATAYDPRGQAWYQTAARARQLTWLPIYNAANSTEIEIVPTLPLYNARREFLGAMAVEVNLEQLSVFLRELYLDRPGEILIIERTGEIVASSATPSVAGEAGARSLATESTDPKMRKIALAVREKFGNFDSLASTQWFRTRIERQPQFVQVTRIRDRYGLDWLLVVAIPEGELTEQIRDITYKTVAICLLSLGGAAALGIYTSRWIARPIWRLAEASRAIAQGDLDRHVPSSRILEFRILSQSLEQTIGNLKRSRAQLADYSRSLEAIIAERTAALRGSEENFAKAFHASPDPILIATFDEGRIIEANDSFLKSSGYTLEEIIDRTPRELNLLARPEELDRLIEKLRQNCPIRNVEARFRTRSGEIRTVLLSAETLTFDERPCVLYIANDISDRVAVETALQRAEERYRSIFENAVEGIYQASPDGSFLSVNPAFVRMYGFASAAELLAATAHLDPNRYNDSAQREQFIELMERDEAVFNFEYQLRRQDGSIIWISENARKVRDNGDRLLYYEGTIQDITQRKEIEAELHQKRQYLRLVLDNIPQQIFWKDRNSVFLGCNKNWAQAACLESPEAVIGLRDEDLLPPEAVEAAEKFRTVDRRIMATNKAEYNTVEAKQRPDPKGNPVWLSVSKIPIHDEGGETIGILGAIEDITSRKIAEEKRQAAEEALRVEQEKSEQLLLNILPEAIAEQLKQNNSPIAEQFEDVAILFGDLVGFTPLSANLPARRLVNFLNRVFSEFDRLAKHYGLEKIKTIGDAYMVAGGLPLPKPDRLEAIAEMALDMQSSIARIATELGQPLQIRIGINTGPVVAGVIGEAKFIYDLWGDTVNVASRMESLGEPGRIQTTPEVYERLKEGYHFKERGEIDVKGKGKITAYWLLGRKSEPSDPKS